MIPLLFLVVATPSQVQVQAGDQAMPPRMAALIQAENWQGLAGWFEKAPLAARKKHYEWWLQSLNRTQRWDRLLKACEWIQPQVEGKGGPRLGTYRLYRAQALSQLGRHGKAAQAHAENGRLGYKDGLSNACSEARMAQDWEALLGFSGEILQKTSENATALAWKGEALARLGRPDEAEPVLRSAAAEDPKNAFAWNSLGQCLSAKKNWAEALKAFDRALKLEPEHLEGLFNRGIALFELKRYQESRDDFRAALAQRPGDPLIGANLRQAERRLAAETSQ